MKSEVTTKTRLINLIAVAVVSTASYFGAHELVSRLSRHEHHASPTPASEPTDAYPQARFWREAETLERVVVDASQILVSYRGATRIESALFMPVRSVPRSRDEARARAIELYETLRRDPSRFAELARLHSDDEASAPFGGAFGAQRVTRFPEEFINALGVTEPGHVTRPFETDAGFHILVRRVAATDPVRVAARVVRIAYAEHGTADLGSHPPRTRDEARSLAESVRQQLQSNPASFLELARAHGEAPNLERDADWGAFMPYETAAEPLAIHALMQVEVGGITEVVDSPNGFLVLQRTDDTAREALAASLIAIGYEGATPTPGIDPNDSEPARPLPHARRVLDEALAEIRRDPSNFDAVRARLCELEFCADEVAHWERGRYPIAAIEEAVLDLRIGEVAPRVIETPIGLFVVRRDAPPPAVASTDYVASFPDNSEWSLRDFIARSSPDQLSSYTRQMENDVLPRLAMTSEEREAVSNLLGEFESVIRSCEPSERLQYVQVTEDEIRRVIGADKFETFAVERDRWFRRMTN